MHVSCSTKRGERTWQSLLRFSQTCKLKSSKAAFTITFFAALNHNYDHKQRTLKHRNTRNGLKSTNDKSQTMTFEPVKVKFCFLRVPWRWLVAATKPNHQLAFELQNSHVCEKRSNMSHRKRVQTLKAFSLGIEARVNQRKMIQKKNSVLIKKKRMRIEGNWKNHKLSWKLGCEITHGCAMKKRQCSAIFVENLRRQTPLQRQKVYKF